MLIRGHQAERSEDGTEELVERLTEADLVDLDHGSGIASLCAFVPSRYNLSRMA